MGQQLYEPVQSWELGAQSTPAQDLAPKGSFTMGENTVLLHNTGQTAVIAQREGWELQNVEPQLGTPKIIGLYDFIRSETNLTLRSIHLVIGDNGRFDKLQADKTLVPADAAQPIPFTPGCYPPSFSTTHNLCFIANGKDPLQVFNGTKIYDAGMLAPPAPTLGAIGGVLPADPEPYSVVITYYDKATGVESSASPNTEIVLVAGGGIQVTWVPYTGEHPWSHTRVYLRQNSNQTEHFLIPRADNEPGEPAPGITTFIS